MSFTGLTDLTDLPAGLRALTDARKPTRHVLRTGAVLPAGNTPVYRWAPCLRALPAVAVLGTVEALPEGPGCRPGERR